MKYADHVAAVLAKAPRPTAEALDVIAANLAKPNGPGAPSAKKSTPGPSTRMDRTHSL